MFWCIADFVGTNVSLLLLMLVSRYRLRCIKSPFKLQKSTWHALAPSLLIWPCALAFWAVPIVLVISNPEHTQFQMDFHNCYFRYTFKYVAVVDLIAVSVIYIHISLNRLLTSKFLHY